MRLSDVIEQFIKTMLTQDEQEIELKRNELAQYFNCAPSQINYVLSTRFTPDHGYIIESRRGGGGYIRIFRMEQDTSEQLIYLIHKRIGESINSLDSKNLITQLVEREIISDDEGNIMKAAICDNCYSLPIPSTIKDALRAKIMTSMLLEIARKKKITPCGKEED